MDIEDMRKAGVAWCTERQFDALVAVAEAAQAATLPEDDWRCVDLINAPAFLKSISPAMRGQVPTRQEPMTTDKHEFSPTLYSDAELRLKVLPMAVQFAASVGMYKASTSALFDVADDMMIWLKTGKKPSAALGLRPPR